MTFISQRLTETQPNVHGYGYGTIVVIFKLRLSLVHTNSHKIFTTCDRSSYLLTSACEHISGSFKWFLFDCM